MRFYKKEDLVIQQKSDESPVTEADETANNILTKLLSSFGWPILSEETKDTPDRLKAPFVWIIDPIDGTRDFIEQTGEFCIMVGLSEYGRSTFGVVHFPATKTTYYGGTELGAFFKQGDEEKPLSVSLVSTPEEATMVMSKSHSLPIYESIAEKLGIKNVARVGSNGLKCSLVASGTADIFYTITSKLGEWDMCAPHAIVEAAGGMVSGIDGTTLTYNKEDPHIPQGVLVTNGLLQDVLLDTFVEQDINPR